LGGKAGAGFLSPQLAQKEPPRTHSFGAEKKKPWEERESSTNGARSNFSLVARAVRREWPIANSVTYSERKIEQFVVEMKTVFATLMKLGKLHSAP